jgi:hypothetical protein
MRAAISLSSKFMARSVMAARCGRDSSWWHSLPHRAPA